MVNCKLPQWVSWIAFAVLALVSTKAAAIDQHSDPFLWLEDLNGERASVWVKKQSADTMAQLSSDPRFGFFKKKYEAIYDRSDRLPSLLGIRQYRNEVFELQQTSDNPRGLLRWTTSGDYSSNSENWRTIVDLDQLSEDESQNWSLQLNYMAFSPSGNRVLIPLSAGGADAVSLREFDLSENRWVEGGFVTPVSRSHAQWLDDDTLLIATVMGDDERTDSFYPRLVREWKRGSKLADADIVYEAPKNHVMAVPVLFETASERHVFVADAKSFAVAELFAESKGEYSRRLELPDRIITSVFSGFSGVGSQAIFNVPADWSVGRTQFLAGDVVGIDFRKMLGQNGSSTDAVSLIYRPTQREALNSYYGSHASTGSSVFLSVMTDVVSRLKQFTLTESGQWQVRDITPADQGTFTLPYFQDPYASSVILKYENFLTPPSFSRMGSDGSITKFRQEPHNADLSGFKTEQFFATSKDGTQVPYFVTHAGTTEKGLAVPVLMFGYGGFGLPITPSFRLPYLGPTHELWLEQGGVFVLANVRGGGEYGPAWHEAAKGASRQNTYDDFYAVAEDLVERGFTSTGRIGFISGSNGGLTAGVLATQRPDLFGAVVSIAPLLDMKRFHKLLSGASWLDEYGNPDDPQQAAHLLRYSPYQNVKSGASYPKIFFMVSATDDRVHPGHARKMAAKMESQGHPFLFYEAPEGGHAMAVTNEGRAKNSAMQMVFLLAELFDGSKE
ncbi:MAG: prolyl oligopeptidase family serine peptidase [Pseudomonadota bacterium]